MNLDKYIEDLLYRNECVVIPNFGAFITSVNSANLNNEGVFTPPSKSISFNKKIKKNDGVLANYIAELNDISFDEAMKLIKLNVSNFNNDILNKKDIVFSKVGVISINEELTEFVSYSNINYLKDSYGLSSVSSSFIKRNKKKAPFSNFSKYAAVLIVGLLISSIVYNNELNKIAQKNIIAYQQADLLIEKEIQKATFVIENPLPLVKMIVKENIGDFHVVAGSFSVEENSFTRLKQLKNKGYKARKIGQNKFGLFQVAYSSFHTRSDADMALEKIRISDNEAAWILNKELN
ncbi:SPOR domain-containing protein [Flavobacteriaceae bacterium]|nr:SPOR domain-containing protein [Flavobacteriaceae bacterium]MDC0497178.1 SPOR domain-containing protein [Flavobacteriaceae bacterium]MDC0622300.1 SPOR domain-containing protein [Flavobacteriaceae bacterium]